MEAAQTNEARSLGLGPACKACENSAKHMAKGLTKASCLPPSSRELTLARAYAPNQTIALRHASTPLHHITLHDITVHCNTPHYNTLQCMTIRCIPLHYSTIKYSTLRYPYINVRMTIVNHESVVKYKSKSFRATEAMRYATIIK